VQQEPRAKTWLCSLLAPNHKTHLGGRLWQDAAGRGRIRRDGR